MYNRLMEERIELGAVYYGPSKMVHIQHIDNDCIVCDAVMHGKVSSLEFTPSKFRVFIKQLGVVFDHVDLGYGTLS